MAEGVQEVSTVHKTDIVLGERYRDTLTGFEGPATAVTFYLHACERVSLEYIKDGEVKYEVFDTPRLVHASTEVQMTTSKTGGPGGREAKQPTVPR